MRSDTGQPVRLSDYRPTDYLIDTVHLDVRLDRTATRVVARLKMRPNPAGKPGAALALDGDELSLTSLHLDGVKIAADVATPDQLILQSPPQKEFELLIETQINPSANTQLMGLYRSGSAYCTQCEAEGFRRITYFLDRPDVLSVYTTRIEAELSDAPILLGNGNLVSTGLIENTNRHVAIWHDPFPKPAYLFALVGGDLDVLKDEFTTMSGRHVDLAIYVEHGKAPRATYAMDSLKRSMEWDEKVFGREYDLDIFNIVAVSDFNMGAMENKGLNVFNDKYVLALPETATDVDFANIEAVIAHEYFHNWTGNRITCRDWFQLCLKEGLTVFRDQEFSSDQRSRAVKRISDVRNLRAAQFSEDAGPLAHNVRPEIYHEINNFYTPTIYEKGAEIIRMLKTLIGAEAFAKGADLYFERFDGTAATVENFISCFAQTSGRDLTQFMRWYQQAGTPKLKVRSTWDQASGTLTVDLEQSTGPTPGQATKLPLVIPVALGLLSKDGTQIPLKPKDVQDAKFVSECALGVFELSETNRTLMFSGVSQQPVLSVLRGFSAPVRIDSDATSQDQITLLAYDSDSFNRWQASQSFALDILRRSVDSIRANGGPINDDAFKAALGEVLKGAHKDRAFTAQVLLLPTESDLAREIGADVDPDAIHTARAALRRFLGAGLYPQLIEIYEALNASNTYTPDATSAGGRSLRNAILDLIAAGNPVEGEKLATQQFASANNMTDRIGALGVLAQIPGQARDNALAQFYASHETDALVLDKWFAIQATIPAYETLGRVRSLMDAHAASMSNPNRLRSLVGAFATANPLAFNAPDGSGYELLANIVIDLDSRNPQVAARLLGAFRSWQTLEPKRRALAQASLMRVAARPTLSADVRDIVTRALN